MPELPSGTVTFLLTDVEGSTQLARALRGAWPKALADHQRLIREAFTAHGGHEIDTQGDAFFFAFPSAHAAVRAGIEGQRALAAHSWPEAGGLKVRIGIHTGPAAPKDGRYTGLAVHRAARISSAAHGGQILLSQTTHDLLEDEEEEIGGCRLRSLGEHRLKDFERPVRLYQVEAEGLAQDFPRLRSDKERRAPLWQTKRRTILAGALAGVIAAAVAIPVFALGGGGSSGAELGDLSGNALGVVRASGKVGGAIDMPAAPSAVAAGLGFIWVASADANAVYTVDPRTNTVHDTIEVESAPGGIAVGAGSVWVTNSLGSSVSQINPQYGVIGTVHVGNGPTGIAVAAGYVWVANTTDHTVSKIRASDGKVKTFAAGSDPSGIAVDKGAVWVASKSTGIVLKLSPDGEVLDQVTVGDGPAAIGIGAGAVWIANSLSDTVSKIDPTSGTVVSTLQVGREPSGIAVESGDVWVANELSSTISRIDAATGKVTTSRLGGRPAGISTGNGLLYVVVRPTGASHRGGTLTPVISGGFEPPGFVDPHVSYVAEAWAFLSLTNDGLLTYRRVAGQAGYQLVPDLARSMPTVSQDGKTYTFQLRPGIRYSTGGAVKASDFRFSVERVFLIRPLPEPAAAESFSAVLGADRCSHTRCDLSRGILTDDRTGTVTYRLSHPDPIFLYKLAAPFAYVAPAGTSLQIATRRPLPATGPYRIASYIPKHSIRLVRNPRFREWSNAAQPDGFPDEIVLRIVPEQSRATKLVEQQKADLVSSSPVKPFPVPTAFRPQLHTYPTTSTFYLALNPTKPPFDDVRVRQALNYALDRSKVIRLAGQTGSAQSTCQVLPPNFPGYRRYCPYTLDPSTDGAWTAPDLGKATRLMRLAGNPRTQVTLWWARQNGAALGRYVVAVLRSLGFRARLNDSFKSLDAYFRSFTMGPARPQILWSGWSADYPAASNFLQLLFICSSPSNFGHFCDRAYDRRVDHVVKVQQSDPAAASNLWADLDREITDKAAWVPLYSQYGVDLVSKRVGNYEHNPQWGALLDQMWVR